MSSSPQPRTNLLVPILLVTVLTVLIVDTLWRPAGLQPILADFYQWLMLLGGVALLLGVINVAVLHVRRIQAGARDWVLSLVLVGGSPRDFCGRRRRQRWRCQPACDVDL